MLESLHPRGDLELFRDLITQIKSNKPTTPLWVVGLDEAGAGCLAGPLFAAAYAFPVTAESETLALSCLVHDSKKLSEKQREEAHLILRDQKNFRFKVKEIPIQTIEEKNIYWARMLAFEELIDEMSEELEGEAIFIVDGPRLHRSSDRLNQLGDKSEVPEHVFAFSKADGTYFAVAAAAILAKVGRDHHMIALAKDFPNYDWQKNKGYATADHREAILQWGLCVHHRPSFCTKIAPALPWKSV